MDLMHVCGTPEGAARGMQLAAGALILGGPPIAILGLVLAAITRREERQWTSGWRRAFTTGFVVQLSSAILSAPLAALSLLWIGVGGDAWEMWLAAVCSASVLGGSLALPAWRQLIAATTADAPVSIRP